MLLFLALLCMVCTQARIDYKSSVFIGVDKRIDGVPAEVARLVGPSSGCVDPRNGDFYIVEKSLHQLLKVSAKDQMVSLVAGDGYDGYNGDNMLANTAQLSGM